MWASSALPHRSCVLTVILVLGSASAFAQVDPPSESDAYCDDKTGASSTGASEKAGGEEGKKRSAPGDHGVRCRRVACKAIADGYLAGQQGAGRVMMKPLDANGNPVIIDGHDGNPMEQTLYVGYGVAVQAVGGGDAGAGLRTVIDAFKHKATRRTVIGCPGQLCRCGSLRVVHRANVAIDGMTVSLDVVDEDDGERNRFFFVHDVSVNRVTSRGACDSVPMDVHTGEFPNPN